MMASLRLPALTSFALFAFAGNSLLCRIALTETTIDAASFTAIRLASGAAFLCVIAARLDQHPRQSAGNWVSAWVLFGYAAAFSFAYTSLTAATGALLLFAAVQITMIGYGLWSGERFSGLQLAGLSIACGGLMGLLLPGLSSPPWAGALLMLAAGVAWGVYSLRGKDARYPLAVTAGNFMLAAPVAAMLSVAMLSRLTWDFAGCWYAVGSGALASGLGYVAWYSALPALRATTASTIQLAVPILAAAGGVVWLGEPMTWRLGLASIAILGGIALVIHNPDRFPPMQETGMLSPIPGASVQEMDPRSDATPGD